MAFLISVFQGLSQLMGSSVSASGMSGGESGVGLFSSSLKCSAHRFSCSLVVVSGFPLILLDAPLYFSVHCRVLFLCPCLSCSCSAVVQHSFPLSPRFQLVDGVGRDPFLVLGLLLAKDLFTCVVPELLAVFPLFQCLSHCLLSALVAAGTCWKG